MTKSYACRGMQMNPPRTPEQKGAEKISWQRGKIKRMTHASEVCGVAENVNAKRV
jgi:hypothetical protein